MYYNEQGTNIFDVIHLSVGRVQRLVALELLASGVGAAALAAGEGPAGAQRRAAAVLLLLRRLALRPSARQGADCNKHKTRLINVSSRSLRLSSRERPARYVRSDNATLLTQCLQFNYTNYRSTTSDGPRSPRGTHKSPIGNETIATRRRLKLSRTPLRRAL